jgi:hypothetical protein
VASAMRCQQPDKRPAASWIRFQSEFPSWTYRIGHTEFDAHRAGNALAPLGSAKGMNAQMKAKGGY